MHIALFVDQHPQSLGGVQTSVSLQKKYLNKMGIEVTVFAPKCKGQVSDPSIKVIPSGFIGPNGEYSMVWSLRKAAAFCEESFASTKFDLVHIQGDFSSTSLGTYLAKRFDLPIVYTAHTNIDFLGNKMFGRTLKTLLLNFFCWQFAHFLQLDSRPAVRNAWEYMAFVHKHSDKVLAPSSHFARELEMRGVAVKAEVIINGVDDDLLSEVQRREPVPQRPVHFVWAGRMHAEKRLLQAIEGFARAKTNATLSIYGVGPLERVAKRQVQARGLTNRISFQGKIPHKDMLQVFADADAVLQTSIGFETQGLTVFEAAGVETPTILSDAKIAAELPDGSYWLDSKGSVESLAKTIKQANKDISQGLTKRDSFGDSTWLHQSDITRRTVEIYESLIAVTVSK